MIVRAGRSATVGVEGAIDNVTKCWRWRYLQKCCTLWQVVALLFGVRLCSMRKKKDIALALQHILTRAFAPDMQVYCSSVSPSFDVDVVF